jgi:hypothetical protein
MIYHFSESHCERGLVNTERVLLSRKQPTKLFNATLKYLDQDCKTVQSGIEAALI